MKSELNQPLPLTPVAQCYHWGRAGSTSLVAQLLGSFEAERPYAELWIGAHPKAPAIVTAPTGPATLDRLIAKFPDEILGTRVAAIDSGTLPFLFKVLSIERALSIQAHPDKGRAQRLFSTDPAHYPDDREKRELAIALSPVQLLYGFMPLEELALTCTCFPELAAIVGEQTLAGMRNASPDQAASVVATAYRAVMNSERDRYAAQVRALVNRLEVSERGPREKMLLSFYREYGAEDRGILSSLLMNLQTLEPGEAVLIRPNVLHAYLSGNLVECMTNSDNVVRGGLTPKFQDLPVLLEMTDYHPGPCPVLKAAAANPPFYRFQTDSPEFEVDFASGPFEIRQRGDQSVKLIFSLNATGEVRCDGVARQFKWGGALLIPAAVEEYSISVEAGTIYRVSVPHPAGSATARDKI